MLKSVERYKLPRYRDLAPVFFWGNGMSGLNPTELKRRRRAAARTLLSDPRGISVAKKKHLVDGVWVDKLPFNAGHAWRAQQALLEADRLAST